MHLKFKWFRVRAVLQKLISEIFKRIHLRFVLFCFRVTQYFCFLYQHVQYYDLRHLFSKWVSTMGVYVCMSISNPCRQSNRRNAIDDVIHAHNKRMFFEPPFWKKTHTNAIRLLAISVERTIFNLSKHYAGKAMYVRLAFLRNIFVDGFCNICLVEGGDYCSWFAPKLSNFGFWLDK